MRLMLYIFCSAHLFFVFSSHIVYFTSCEFVSLFDTILWSRKCDCGSLTRFLVHFPPGSKVSTNLPGRCFCLVATATSSCTEHELSSSCFQSIILPVYNASCWLDECLLGILHQDFTGSMELSVFDDASTVCLFARLHVRLCLSWTSVRFFPLHLSIRTTRGKCWRVGVKSCRQEDL